MEEVGTGGSPSSQGSLVIFLYLTVTEGEPRSGNEGGTLGHTNTGCFGVMPSVLAWNQCYYI